MIKQGAHETAKTKVSFDYKLMGSQSRMESTGDFNNMASDSDLL